jgi:ABC-type polysaccharide/polyol phosphate transport system ATPase subunit
MKTIEAINVSKLFRLRHTGTPTLKSRFVDTIKRRRGSEDFWALRNINFSAQAGETIGVIGPNGCGKTTLLSIIASTMAPTTGRVITRGRLASLLELGAGFHPDLTGRENIFLNGAIMGIPRRTIEEKFDSIVAFSGLDHFIETPIKFYSSGMVVRLGFSVAIEVNPDILLVDEVLAVGDQAFQKKSSRRIQRMKEAGKTLLVASHDMGTIRRFCDRVIHLQNGEIDEQGVPAGVVDNYIQSAQELPDGLGKIAGWGTMEAVIRGVEFRGSGEDGKPAYRTGDDFSVEIDYFAARRIENPVFGYAVHTHDFQLCSGSNTQIDRCPVEAIEGPGVMRLSLESLPLLRGHYLLSLSIHSQDHNINYHRQDYTYPFDVVSSTDRTGIVDATSRWDFRPGGEKGPGSQG